ncbi:hypothetical protein [Micrococcus sp.]|uniref:hypothetical protein n=1 Tax=Micrococcus sp. TaxID=1271 RepID=UPI002A91A41E|nr:hypothetical protein [Micrococcus sp.]MDY6054337.1 hypothetical protein [Micrococcus sp.]
MTTLILDWSALLDRPETGTVTVVRKGYEAAPETLRTPWSTCLRVDGRATLDVDGGSVVDVTWTPDGATRSYQRTVLVPAEGEHLAHLLERVDKATLDPLPEADAVSAAEALARAEGAAARAGRSADVAVVSAGLAEAAADAAVVSAGSAEDAASRAEAAARPGLIVTQDLDLNLRLSPNRGAAVSLDAEAGVVVMEVSL